MAAAGFSLASLPVISLLHLSVNRAMRRTSNRTHCGSKVRLILPHTTHTPWFPQNNPFWRLEIDLRRLVFAAFAIEIGMGLLYFVSALL
jgi:hypothetical protein